MSEDALARVQSSPQPADPIRRPTPKSVVAVMPRPEPDPMTPVTGELGPLPVTPASTADASIVPASRPGLPTPAERAELPVPASPSGDVQPLTDSSVPYAGIAEVGEQQAQSEAKQEAVRRPARSGARAASSVARVAGTIIKD